MAGNQLSGMFPDMNQRTGVVFRPFAASFILLLLLLIPLAVSADEQAAGKSALFWGFATGVDEPEQEMAGQLNLPNDGDTFKIEVGQDGLYALSGAELAAAGMNLTAVNPDKIQMMQRGQPVAYQFINHDGNAGFGPGDEIRFFGWAFDGTRYEDMYVSNNVFWLWAGENGSQVQTTGNDAGKGYPKVTWFNESITRWPHLNYFPGLTVNWQASPNEATPWHWMRIKDFSREPKSIGLPIDIPNPAQNTGQNATVLVEFTSRYNSLKLSPESYEVTLALNGHNNSTSQSWEGGVNLNVVHQTPVSQFSQPGDSGYPKNTIDLQYQASTADEAEATIAYITRATVEYPRALVAVGNELIFNEDQAGKHEFHIGGFSLGSTEEVIVWDVSDKYNPRQVLVGSSQILTAAGSTTVVVGRQHEANGRFIATTTNNLRQVEKVTKYVPAALTPPQKAGTWIAVSHHSLLPAARELAAYRAQQSGISTWVVDVDHIANQVGYGFNTPQAIRDYLRDALSSWEEPPKYLILFGDATVNPRGLGCEFGCQNWDAEKPTLVPTDLLFIDRFNGLIPVDFTFSTLTGDDLIPELAVGRVTAETLVEAQSAVNKIKLYEESFAAVSPRTRNMLFVADDPDGGGNFCQVSTATASRLPLSVNKTFLCLPVETVTGPTLEESTEALRLELFHQINDIGMAILNYRGHGGVNGWASPNILHVEDDDLWQNVGRPLIVVSADCLDGHFAQVWEEGLAETFFDLGNNRGTAAHWSSSGLGYAYEHTILVNAFYDALFKERVGAIGDAINQAKVIYLNKGYDESEAYSFTLLGDPAMVAYRWTDTGNLPLIMRAK